MNLDVLKDLYKVIDYTAKKLFKSLEISIRYSILSILLLIPVLVNLFNLVDYSILYLISILSGLIGSTVLTIYIALVTFLLNKHIDLSRLHYMNIRDMLSNFKNRGDMKNYYQFLEELLVVNKVSIEYIPVTLIPAYSALLFINDRLYFSSFILIYMVLCTAMFYEAVSSFNNHVVYENKIEKEIYNLIESSDLKEYIVFRLRKIDLILSIISFSIYLTYLLLRTDYVFAAHANTHRVNYQELAKYIVNQLRI